MIVKVDVNSKITLPKDFKLQLGIEPNSYLEAVVMNNKIVLSKPSNACLFCGKESKKLYKNKAICNNCIGWIARLKNEKQTQEVQRDEKEKNRIR